MEKLGSYLQHLKFNEKLRDSFIAKYFANPRLLILVLVAILTLGVSSYTSLPRRLNPEIKLPRIIVTTVLPGANPQDVESLVTRPIEDGISGVENITKVNSSSTENVSLMDIEFSNGVEPDKARSDIQSAIDQVELPSDAQAPKVVTIDFENQPVWQFALVGKGDTASLNRFAKTLKNDLENLSTIDNVTTGGLEEQEISITINESKLATYNLTPFQLSGLIKSSLASFPAGTVVTKNSSFALSIDPAVTSIRDIRNLQININGTVVPLSSVASISERSKPNQFPSYIASNSLAPERSVSFNVYKTKTTNIDTAVRDAEKKVEESLSTYNGQFATRTITNSGEEIDKQFNDLIRDFSITIILVFLVLFIFLGLRQAFVSLFSVPLTFLISFTVMRFTGTSLNFLSMFSLLLSLGLLVDDTIVVISAMTSYFKTGRFTSLQTGLLVWKDFLIAILTTTLTTVFAFLPLLLATGIIGEFIKSIPIVVSSTLIASFFVGMFITLPLMIFLLQPAVPNRVKTLLKILVIGVLIFIFISILPKGPLMIISIIAAIIFLFITAQVRQQLVTQTTRYVQSQSKKNNVIKHSPRYIENGLISFETISSAYRRVILKILATRENRRKAVVMVIIFSIFSYLLVPFGFVKNEFFPKSDQNYIYLGAELPSGTNSVIAEEEAKSILEKIRHTPNISYAIADIGQSLGGFGSAQGSESNNVLISVSLPDAKKRNESSIVIAQKFRDVFANYDKGKITVTEISGGPPAGADLQINISGDDLTTLDAYGTKVMDYLKSQKGVTDVTKSIKPGTSKIVFVPDQEQLAANNITTDQLGLWLRTFASGFTLDSARIDSTAVDNDKKDITLRTSNSLQKLTDITTITFPGKNGAIPLSNLGTLSLKSNPTLITREDGKRTITVSGTVLNGYSSSTLNQGLEKYATSSLGLPSGYSWKTGGVNEENQSSVTSILLAMLLSFLLIIVTMVVQFNSFRKAVIVMLVIPLSISGVFIIFALTRTPLSFPALIGVLALFGIVVKNSILIVDKIDANEKIGLDFVHGIADGTASRLEPIALTTLAAIMGLVPITISDPLWRGLGGAIIAGLTFSGTIMLFFIPVIYYMWLAPKEESRRARRSRIS